MLLGGSTRAGGAPAKDDDADNHEHRNDRRGYGLLDASPPSATGLSKKSPTVRPEDVSG